MNALIFYDYGELNQILAVQLGVVPAGSSNDTVLRVVNANDIYQAEDVVVDLTGPDAAQLYLSSDGSSFSASISVGDIPPGAGSAPIYLRRVTPSTDTAGPREAFLRATPSGWTELTSAVPAPASGGLEGLDDNGTDSGFVIDEPPFHQG